MEKVIYENKPGICLAIGTIGVAHGGQSLWGLFSGLCLIACAALIWHWRQTYRRRVKVHRRIF